MEYSELTGSDLSPTPENIEKTFNEDSIGRNNEVYSFIKILRKIQNDSCVIALDGSWGVEKLSL